jgi:hypothetical protein
MQRASWIAVLFAIVALPVFAQNYSFNDGNAGVQLTAGSNGLFVNPPYYVTRTGAGVEDGFVDDGSVSSTSYSGGYGADPGDILSQAKGTSHNNNMVNFDEFAGIQLSFGAYVTAEAYSYASSSYASAPAPYKYNFGESTGMMMAWNVWTDSTLTVSDLTVSVTNSHTGTGAAWALASWNITIANPDGTIVAQYSKNDGASFTAPVPAFTVVRISWNVMALATAPYRGDSGNAQATTAGTLTVIPAP